MSTRIRSISYQRFVGWLPGGIALLQTLTETRTIDGDLGVIPRLGFDGRSLYRPGVTHSPKEIQSRLDEFHEPYQLELSAALEGSTSSSTGTRWRRLDPPVVLTVVDRVPAACVGNCGDAHGNALPGDLITCAPDDLIFAGQSLNFHLDRHLKASVTVGINEPFEGLWRSASFAAWLGPSG